jgi:hypothetical protein
MTAAEEPKRDGDRGEREKQKEQHHAFSANTVQGTPQGKEPDTLVARAAGHQGGVR